VNALVLPSVAAFSFWLFLCPNSQSAPNVNALLLLHFLAFNLCAQCECASVAAFFCWLFLRPNSQSVPNVNALLLPHFLACHFCAQIVSVHPM